jgi:hypothetical protein
MPRALTRWWFGAGAANLQLGRVFRGSAGPGPVACCIFSSTSHFVLACPVLVVPGASAAPSGCIVHNKSLPAPSPAGA